MKKQDASIAIVIIGLLVLVSLFFIFPSDEPGLETVKLAINEVPHSVLIFIAEEKGFFAEQGLRIERYSFPSGKVALDSMLAGGADIATTADFPISLAGLSGQEFYAVATMGHGNYLKIIGRRDSGIETSSDLRGKRIATKKGATSELFMLKVLEKEGILLNEVNVIYMEPPNLPLALVRGDIDAFVTWEPHISNTERELGGNAIVFSPKDVAGEETWNIVVQKNFAEAKEETVKKFLQALFKAEEFYNINREEAVIITMKYSGASEEAVMAVLNSLEIDLSLNEVLKNKVEEGAQWAIKENIVDKEEMPNFDTILNHGFLQQVKPSAVLVE